MKSIDLHGCIEIEAISAVEMALMSLNPGEEIEIITGNGNVLRDVAIEIIIEEGYKYHFEGNNLGAIIVEG